MCGRYTIKDPVALAALISRLTGEPFELVAARYNVSPSQLNPVVRRGKKGQPEGTLMRWGLVPHWKKDATPGDARANARSEDMFSRATFKAAVQNRRCAVGADGFYEWKRLDERTKIPHHISLKGGAAFFIAGLFETADEARPETFALLTTGPNAVMAPIHDRMPVILRGDALQRWIEPGPISPEEARQICQPFAADEMEAWPVSQLVNSTKHDSPVCAQPALDPPAPTQGLLSL